MQNWQDTRVNQPHCFFVYIPIIAPVDFLQYTHNSNNVGNYLSLHKHFTSTLSLVVFLWGSKRTAMHSTYLPLLTYLKCRNNLFFHYTPLLYCLCWGCLLYLDWDRVILLQASHRECQGREGNTLIAQVTVFDMSLFQHCFLSKLFSLKSVISCV